MNHRYFLVIHLLTAQAAAQTRSGDALSIVVSEIYSVFTSLTSALGQTASATSNPTTSEFNPATETSSESSLSSFTDSAASSTAASAAATPTSSLSQSATNAATSASSFASSASASAGSSVSSITSASAAASSSAASALSSVSQSASSAVASASSSAAAAAQNAGGGNHDRTLAIALGTVLGALALGLLILLILILCRRRRKRAAKRRYGSHYSTSEEAVATHKPMASRHGRTAPLFNSNRKSLGRHHNPNGADVPVHSEYDMPYAHEFQEADTVPFVPTGASKRTSATLPAEPETALGTGNHFRNGNGLNNHPYQDGHHTGAALAAGAGGAALGAAAARRHSRSSERHAHPSARLSGNPEVHPEFWDEPPPRSSKRSSIASSRRSGSMPRSSFHWPQEFENGPGRSGLAAAAAAGTAGAAVGGIASQHGRHSHERGRPVSTEGPLHHGQPYGVGPEYSTTRPGDIYGTRSTEPPRTDYYSDRPTRHSDMGPALGAAAVGAGIASHGRSRSRSHPQAPLPSSLVAANSQQRRNLPSRSPKRARFSGGDTYHSIPHHEDEFHDEVPISPPATGPTEFGDPSRRSLVRNSRGTEELVSPISSHDRNSMLMHAGPGCPDTGGFVHRSHSGSISPPETSRRDETPPSSVSPLPSTAPVDNERSAIMHSTHQLQPQQHQHQHQHHRHTYPPVPPLHSTATPTPNHARPRQHSGLINAVQDHFHSSSQSPPNYPPPHYEPYHPYTPSDRLKSSAASDISTIDPSVAAAKRANPVSRKPLPFIHYSSNNQVSPYQSSSSSTAVATVGTTPGSNAHATANAPLLSGPGGGGDGEAGYRTNSQRRSMNDRDHWWRRRHQTDPEWQEASYADHRHSGPAVGWAR